MAQACSIQSGALDGALDVQFNHKERTRLSGSSAHSAAACAQCPVCCTSPSLVVFLFRSLAHSQIPGDSHLSDNLKSYNAAGVPDEQQPESLYDELCGLDGAIARE